MLCCRLFTGFLHTLSDSFSLQCINYANLSLNSFFCDRRLFQHGSKSPFNVLSYWSLTLCVIPGDTQEQRRPSCSQKSRDVRCGVDAHPFAFEHDIQSWPEWGTISQRSPRAGAWSLKYILHCIHLAGSHRKRKNNRPQRTSNRQGLEVHSSVTVFQLETDHRYSKKSMSMRNQLCFPPPLLGNRPRPSLWAHRLPPNNNNNKTPASPRLIGLPLRLCPR